MKSIQRLRHFLLENRRRARWAGIGLLAVATLGMHAVLTAAGNTPSGNTRPQPMPIGTAAVDFQLPTASSSGDTAAVSVSQNGPVTVTAQLDRRSVLAGSDGEMYAEVIIKGEKAAQDHRVPSDLIVVLDQSGSMAGEKIHQARHAALDLLDRLADDDRFALIAFSSSANLLIAPSLARDELRPEWRRRIRSLSSGGGTNMHQALSQTLSLLKQRRGNDRPCRVLLLSDGHPDSTHGLDHLARQAGLRGAALSSLGIGSDYNEVLMAQLADLGSGNYYYLDHPESLAAVFAGELEAGRTTVARGLEIHLRPADGVQLVDVSGYPIERQAGNLVVRPGDLFSGQSRRLWLNLRVATEGPYEPRNLGDLKVRFKADGELQEARVEPGLQVACVDDPQMYLSSIDSDAWGRAVVNEEYGVLQNLVSGLIRKGRKAEAQKQIDGYVARQSRQNAHLKNAAVSSNLAEVEKLREEVDQVFEGPDQALKQKRMVKKRHELSQQLRRLEAAPKSSKGGS